MTDPTTDPTTTDPTTIDPATDAAVDPTNDSNGAGATVARGELVDAVAGAPETAVERREAVEEPAKVMRIGSMIKQLLEEVRHAELDEPARGRLREIYDTSITELGSALSPDLREELDRVAIPFGDSDHPSEAELQVAQAQLVGWLEGLFHGIQATLFAQQVAARSQFEGMRQQLPGQAGPGGPGGPGAPDDGSSRPGTYL